MKNKHTKPKMVVKSSPKNNDGSWEYHPSPKNKKITKK